MEQKTIGGNADAANQDVIRTTILEMCQPFGGVAQWQVESANEGLFRCSVRLADPKQHSLMVKTLGARLQGRGVELDIRLRERSA